MGQVEARWDNTEQSVIRQVYHSGYTRHDAKNAIKATYDMAKTVQHPIAVIMDFSDSYDEVPVGKLASMTRFIEQHVPPNQAHVVIVKPNRYLQLIMQTTKMLLPKASANQHIAGSVEAAHDYLSQHGYAKP